jgi:hypothetical protein
VKKGNRPPIKTVEDNPLETRTLLFIAVPLVLLAAAGIYGHAGTSADPNHATGALLVLDHLFNLLIAAAMFVLFFAVGRRLLSLCGFEWRSFAEEFVFSTGLGAGVLALMILAAAFAGLLNPYVVGSIFLVALVLCGTKVLRLVEVARSLISRDYSRPAEIAYILAFASVVLVMVLRALSPPHAYDEAIYHLAAVKRFIALGTLAPLYDIAQGNTHVLVHMLYAPCLMIGADSATKLLSVGFGLLTAVSLFAYARRFLDSTTGYVAALALFGAGMVVEVATTARIDVTLAGMLFLATYAMTVYLEDRSLKWLWLSAIFAGVGVGVKLTGLLWVALLGFTYLAQTLYKATAAQRLIGVKRGALYFLILLALVSPWFLKNYVYFHDPFYPFVRHETVTGQRSEPITYFGATEEEKLERHFQRVKERNGALVERIRGILAGAATRRTERHPLWFWGYFTNPGLYNVGEPFHTPNYLFVLCPLFLLFGRDRRLMWLAGACVVFFVIMASSAWIARYLLPIYPPLTLIAAFVVVRTTGWLTSKSPLARALPVVLLLLTTGGTLLVSVAQLIKTRDLNYVNGSLSRADYLSQFFYYPSLRQINENTSPETKVFMMGCQMGYDLQRPYVADTSWDSTPWRRLLLKADSPPAVRDTMKAEGITHVLYSPDLFAFATMTGRLSVTSAGGSDASRPDFYEQWRNWVTFEEFKEQFLEPIYRDQYGYTLFRLK